MKKTELFEQVLNGFSMELNSTDPTPDREDDMNICLKLSENVYVTLLMSELTRDSNGKITDVSCKDYTISDKPWNYTDLYLKQKEEAKDYMRTSRFKKDVINVLNQKNI